MRAERRGLMTAWLALAYLYWDDDVVEESRHRSARGKGRAWGMGGERVLNYSDKNYLDNQFLI